MEKRNRIYVQNIFQGYDKDKSGKLDGDEFADMCYDLGYYIPASEVKEIFVKLAKVDLIDSSKGISFEVCGHLLLLIPLSTKTNQKKISEQRKQATQPHSS